MTAEERADLIAFLRSLTDEKFLTDPRYSDPWKERK
jgi:cytochrome c peroxidase